MASIVQSPDALSLLGNLKTFKISALAPLVFKLTHNGSTLIEETYAPDAEELVHVDVKDVVAQYIAVSVPASNVFSQTAHDFSYYLDDIFIGTFRVIPGGVRRLADTVSNFLKRNWLTWQPKVKLVRWNQPEHLTYYHEAAGVVKAMFYLVGGGTETVTVHSADAGDYLSYNMEMEHLCSLSSHAASDLLGTVDVWVEDTVGNRLSYIQRYTMTPDTASEHYYMSVNSLGGIDTFCFSGALSLSPSIGHESGQLDGRKVSIDADPERAWSQNTGLMGKTESVWLWEFFAAKRQWGIIDGNLEEIVLDSSSIEWNDAENLTSCDFSFTLAEDGRQLNSPRTAMRFSLASVPTPEGQPRVLEPRLTDYPNAVIEDSLLFLAQSPYVQEWKKISLGAIRQWIKTVLPIVAVVDSLQSDRADLALSARQGKALKALIDAKVIEAGGVPFDDTPTEDSMNAVTSGGVWAFINDGYTVMGVASHATDPGEPDRKVCYFASDAGEYQHFDNITVGIGEVAALLYDGSSWTKNTISEVPEPISEAEYEQMAEAGTLQNRYYFIEETAE